MSRVGKKLIEIPETVSVEQTQEKIIVKGKHGILEKNFPKLVKILIEGKIVSISRLDDTKIARSNHGLTRALVQNMILGVNQRFTKILLAEGVGYKFQLDSTKLNLSMGYSHPISIEIPSEIQVKLESPTKLLLSSIDKEKVGLLAAKIRDIRPPEPYKGKGIRYENEIVRRKAGKTGK